MTVTFSPETEAWIAERLDAGGKSGRAAHRRARLLHSGGGLKPMPRCADKPVVQ